ncbi:MAG: sodium:solute symporter, partial [Bacteroidia bacterium]|nr:sodium:solute symporter [Bacteroidia bacterium]
NNNLYYFQFILGTIVGYLFIAFVLTPIYYKLKLVSIYTYLNIRFGNVTYKTGSLFFLVSQSFGAALRLLLSIKILQYAFFDALHIPYFVTIIVVLGLDQSMMQKTLTVKNSKDAKKNVLTFSFFIAFAQTLFLGLGILIYLYAEWHGIKLATQNGQFVNTDSLYPLLTLNYFGKIGTIAFLIGIIASTFASIDSCIAALTTAFSYDFMNIANQPQEAKKRIKNNVLLGVNIVMFIIVMSFWKSQGAIINTIFKIAGYTYGPILGLYLTGLFSRIKMKEKWVPVACVAAAFVTWLLNEYFIRTFHFDFGFMNIFVNALLTVLFLVIIKKKE